VTQQIDERLQAFQTDNTMLQQAIAAVHAARQAEDAAYYRFSSKDFASDDLKREDALEDKYMSTVRALLNALLCLPEDEPLRRKAQLAVQLFKDFGFQVSDGFEAEARKTLNMVQQWQAATDYTLAELGIEPWVGKAAAQAQKVTALITQRVDNESAKVKGELAEARKATDEAVRRAYDILNALAVLQPTDGLAQLMSVLFSIEDRAKLYYISGGKLSEGGQSSPQTPEGGSSDPDPSTGGGSSEGGSGTGDNTGSGSSTPTTPTDPTEPVVGEGDEG